MTELDPIARERAAQERRHWVRLTWVCNNRCRFCHDALVHTGEVISSEAVKADMREGLTKNSTRLILSGGEPTIHPDFVELVAYGKGQGYGWVQAVSNGRMFAYPGFAQRSVEAGLDEVTLSMHGHTAELHDWLVGVPGAFEQSMRGLANLQAQDGLVLSVDVVLNARNLPEMPGLMDFYLSRGIREFDLLWLVPFGRAWEQREELFVPAPADLAPLEKALELARSAGAVVWTNRLPPALLEGHEALIQDPHKLHDEVRGRQREFDALLAAGQPLRCREPDRCLACFMSDYCDQLELLLERTAAAGPETVRCAPMEKPPTWLADAARLHLVAGSAVGAAAKFVRSLPGVARRVVLEVSGRPDANPSQQNWGDSSVLDRVASWDPESLDALLAIPDLPLEVVLDRRSAEWAANRTGQLAERTGVVMVSLRAFGGLEELERSGVSPSSGLASLPPQVELLGIPPCLRPAAVLRVEEPPLGEELFGEDGGLVLEAFSEHFIQHHYRIHSFRCSACSARASCPGLPVHYVRCFGLGILAPERLV